jgi:sterol desaturase/sphingolipid hydroxylase (fatty acid hydroxylase superfamily)
MKIEYVRHTSERLFQNDFLEACSKVHPVTPFAFYIPIITGLMAWGLWTGTTSVGMAALFAPLGWLTWCAMEYGIHRGFFHWEGNGPFTRKLHHILHGYHHQFPDDPLRLVMPLGASIPLAIVISGLLWLVGRPEATIPYFCGIVAGYLVYDFLHWSVHYRKPRTAWGKAMRSHHMAHHFACPERNFGISHRWVDRLVGSLQQRGQGARSPEDSAPAEQG